MTPDTLLRDKHVEFIHNLYKLPPTSLESLMTLHIRINGIYWALLSLHLLGEPEILPRRQLIDEIAACRHSSGGYGSAPGHDPHVVCTLHAIQILTLLDARESMDEPSTASWIASLQVPSSGAITGDEWGEVDMRLNYAATQALSLLNRLDAIDVPALYRYVLSCRNFDGGFGMVPGAESHAAHAFTSLGTLSILSRHLAITLDSCLDVDQIAWWLSLRQVKSGGFNGRPEKLEDVCYSWYVLSSLAILRRDTWISRPKLRAFILSAQEPRHGGISDRPGDVADINHTCFGLAGLALIGTDQLAQIDPRYCLPLALTRRLGL